VYRLCDLNSKSVVSYVDYEFFNESIVFWSGMRMSLSRIVIGNSCHSAAKIGLHVSFSTRQTLLPSLRWRARAPMMALSWLNSG
jgi:hypothetical protein